MVKEDPAKRPPADSAAVQFRCSPPFSKSESKCSGYLKSDTGAAYFVTHKLEYNSGHYIPKSQVRYGRKILIEGTNYFHYSFTLPDWLIEKKRCHELVTN